MMKAEIQHLEELGMGGPRPVIDASTIPVQGVRTETDRKIAAVELGLTENASWERIDRVVESNNNSSSFYRR